MTGAKSTNFPSLSESSPPGGFGNLDPDKTQIGGSHYKQTKIQVTEYCIANRLEFAEGNVVKYVTRHKTKGKAEDIKKAIHYLLLVLKHEYGTTYN